MSGNKFQSHCIEDQVTPTTSMVSSRSSTKEANRRKRCERRIQWDVDNDNNMSLERASKRRTIHHSVTSTDLTKAICGRVGKPRDKNQKSIAHTGSVEARLNDQKGCERYGLVATAGCAGTFKMSIVADGVCGPDGKCLVEFTVWKKMKSPELRRLWFTVRHRMLPAATVGIRALEIWTDRKEDYPTKVVFLHK
ncbi:uncharacterized protein LOC113551026 [Rhopalosiphum maidis]|uniref:uncharacterized protein LOC113551026 n=1 Tax=Rhopalosiphum maidis TaxID=43146 RepID=UPI000EFF22A2|nr:uncharacterized protein LOC113551026 [Rhopalosiphum maidis]